MLLNNKEKEETKKLKYLKYPKRRIDKDIPINVQVFLTFVLFAHRTFMPTI